MCSIFNDMKNKNRKAQVAMEFLTTYGWAILAMLIAVAALGYFYLSPSDLMEDSCSFDKTGCSGFQVTKNSATEITVAFEFNNPEPNTITVTNVDFVVNGQAGTVANCASAHLPIVTSAGRKVVVQSCILTTFGNLKEDKEIIDVKVQYTIEDETFPKYLTGEIIAKAR